jgi:hypothetical protein
VCIDPETRKEADIINIFQRGSEYLVHNLVKTNRVYTKKRTWEILSDIAEWEHVSFLLEGIGEVWTVQQVLMSAVDTLGNKRQLFQYWMRVVFGSAEFAIDLFEHPYSLRRVLTYLRIRQPDTDMLAGCEFGSVPCRLALGCTVRTPDASVHMVRLGVQSLEQVITGPSAFLAEIAKTFLGHYLYQSHDSHDCLRARNLLGENRKCFYSTCPHFNGSWYRRDHPASLIELD